MSDEHYMAAENLYVVFPEGLAAGRTAHVLGTWTETANGERKEKLALINCLFESITGTKYKIEGARYTLEVNVVGDKLHVRLLDAEGEDPSELSILSKL